MDGRLMDRNITSDSMEVDGQEHCIGMGGRLMVRSTTFDGVGG